MNIEFRMMKYEDIEEVISLCNLCFDENTSLEYAKRIFKENENDKNQIYLIGVVEEKIIAHLKINIIPTIYENMNTYAILNHVCIHPDYRRHHFGTKLLDEAFRICRENDCKTVELWSKNFRVPAHALYNKYGFIVEDAKFLSLFKQSVALIILMIIVPPLNIFFYIKRKLNLKNISTF